MWWVVGIYDVRSCENMWETLGKKICEGLGKIWKYEYVKRCGKHWERMWEYVERTCEKMMYERKNVRSCEKKKEHVTKKGKYEV